MIKVLSIGNSFSQDAQHFLHDLSMHGEEQIYCVNLFIGGCSLETHYNNIKENKKAYAYELNGKHTDRTVSVEEALTKENWDFITLQQASWLSGKEESYHPFIEEIVTFVREKSNATLLIHKTWAYEHNVADNPYGSQENMHKEVIATYKGIAKQFGFDIIPVGEVIGLLRATKEFDYNGGQPSLNRDGQHLGLDYGRFAAALCWYKALTKKSVKEIGFLPYEFKITADSMAKINKIKEIVEET